MSSISGTSTFPPLGRVMAESSPRRDQLLRRRGPFGTVRDARPSDALALRPCQREPAARRPTLRATISQRRWPPPLRPPQWHVLGFQDQAECAARTVIAETKHGHWLGAEVHGCELKGRFVGHGPFPLVRGP